MSGNRTNHSVKYINKNNLCVLICTYIQCVVSTGTEAASSLYSVPTYRTLSLFRLLLWEDIVGLVLVEVDK